MKKRLFFLLLTLAGCQQESLQIESPYRIRLAVSPAPAAPPANTLVARQIHPLKLDLRTDSYYDDRGYQLVFYQQSGLGRLYRDTMAIGQKVPVTLPLGVSEWIYIPEAPGASEVVLVAQQAGNFTQPDTVRLKFQVNP